MRSRVLCCMQRFRYVLNKDEKALIVVINYMCNYFVKSHAHLRSILYGMCNSYSLMKDGTMSIGTMIIEDNICKPGVASPCLSWKTT